MIRLGISACLLGNPVRYDGGHKLDRWLRDELGAHAEFVIVCPEMELGLGAPRETMDLFGSPDCPKLITSQTRTNLTSTFHQWCELRLASLATTDISGFIFKSKSPSCGIGSAKVFSDSLKNNYLLGTGLFAQALVRAFPQMPVVEAEQLQTEAQRNQFLETIGLDLSRR